MAQMLAAALQQPRESGISIEHAHKLGVKPYDGSGDPERALSLIEGNEEIFQMMGVYRGAEGLLFCLPT